MICAITAENPTDENAILVPNVIRPGLIVGPVPMDQLFAQFGV